VSLEKDRRQKSAQAELPLTNRGEAPGEQRSGESRSAAHGSERSGTAALMERVVEGRNAKAAWKRVKQNKGSPGVDGMTVGDDLDEYMVENWAAIREQLLEGSYQPSPVRRVEIPKSGGGVRMLGIPTVLDRIVQQCILQVLQPMFDPTFSQYSYGFRPGRSAHPSALSRIDPPLLARNDPPGRRASASLISPR
jgi:RNA-directed DNA polymerase